MVYPAWWARDNRQPGNHVLNGRRHTFGIRTLHVTGDTTGLMSRSRFRLYVMLPVLTVLALVIVGGTLL